MSDGWLYGRDGHIREGDEIKAGWQHEYSTDPSEWLPTNAAGHTIGGLNFPARVYRRPAAEGCECLKCTATPVQFTPDDIDRLSKEGAELGKRFAERTRGMVTLSREDWSETVRIWRSRAEAAEKRVAEVEAERDRYIAENRKLWARLHKVQAVIDGEEDET